MAFAVTHARRGGRRDGHGEPQPARVQRLQGLLGQRRADHPAARRGHRRRRSTRRPRPSAVARALDRGAASEGSCALVERARDALLDARAPRSRVAPGERPRRSASSTRRCTASATRSLEGRWPRRASPTSSRCPSSRARRRFPHRRFPNPEEKGALDLRSRARASAGADLVLANDPDADRLAVAVARRSAASCVAAHRQRGRRAARPLPAHRGQLDRAASASGHRHHRLVAQLGEPSRATLGVRYEETLTGFKWIANRAHRARSAEGTRFVFGYEEALGYTVGDLVRDKDGIGAARGVRRARGRSAKREGPACSSTLRAVPPVRLSRERADGASRPRETKARTASRA